MAELPQRGLPFNQSARTGLSVFLLESLNTGITFIMTWQQPNTELKLVQLIMVDSRGEYGELKH